MENGPLKYMIYCIYIDLPFLRIMILLKSISPLESEDASSILVSKHQNEDRTKKTGQNQSWGARRDLCIHKTVVANAKIIVGHI
jgi:hypothetical protein